MWLACVLLIFGLAGRAYGDEASAPALRLSPQSPRSVLHLGTGAEEVRARRRWRWLGPLLAGGATLAAGAVTGSLALLRAQEFWRARDGGAGEQELYAMQARVRSLSFTTDALLGATAVLAGITLIVRFGTGGGERAPEAPIQDFETPRSQWSK